MKANTKYNFIKIYIQIALILIGISLTSCKKFVDIGLPTDKLTSEKVFSDSSNATSAILGIYIDIAKVTTPNLLSGGPSLYGGLMSDELRPRNITFDIGQFYSNAIATNNNTNLADLWRFGYVLIYRANACIEGLDESKGISVSLKNQLTGEAKFIRALCYFYLANFYGDIPLVTTSNYQVNGSVSRTSTILVYEQILRDLNEAKELIKENYVTTGRLRPNRATVLTLLARIYLYQKQWSKAEQAATEVINQTNLYGLELDLKKVFEINSRESIWQINSVQMGFETPDGVAFIPANATVLPNYNISQTLLNAFEPNDGRRTNWIAKRTITVNGQPADFFYPFKYKLRNSGWTEAPLESYCIFRLAELYLLRAEARANQNKFDLAKDDLNAIRNRSGLGNTAANSQASLLDAIYQEKQIEFFCEGGHRWFDLKRTERINTVMSEAAVVKGTTWNINKLLLPIPISQIVANPSLLQNPGYN